MTQISFPLTTHPAHTPVAAGWTSSTVLTALRAMLEGGFHRLRQAWRHSAALRELHALDARTLKDIGLHRGDLPAIADGYARRGIVGGSARRASAASKSPISPAASNLPACSIRTTSGCGLEGRSRSAMPARFAGCSGSTTGR